MNQCIHKYVYYQRIFNHLKAWRQSGTYEYPQWMIWVFWAAEWTEVARTEMERLGERFKVWRQQEFNFEFERFCSRTSKAVRLYEFRIQSRALGCRDVWESSACGTKAMGMNETPCRRVWAESHTNGHHQSGRGWRDRKGGLEGQRAQRKVKSDQKPTEADVSRRRCGQHCSVLLKGPVAKELRGPVELAPGGAGWF